LSQLNFDKLVHGQSCLVRTESLKVLTELTLNRNNRLGESSYADV